MLRRSLVTRTAAVVGRAARETVTDGATLMRQTLQGASAVRAATTGTVCWALQLNE